MNRIALKILAFNLLLVFLPIGSYFFLDIYEDQLLNSLEHALVQQARLISAALAGDDYLDKEIANDFLSRLEQKHTARYRILDENGVLLADSATLGIQDETGQLPVPSGPEDPEKDTRDSFMYQIASSPVRMLRRFFLPPVPAAEAPLYPEDLKEGPEVQAALAGNYGSFTRISSGGQISVTLYSALPIMKNNKVIGAAVVSQSTFRILRDLYETRLIVFRIFLYSIAAAGLLTFVSAITISFPLNKLREEALVGLAPTSKNEIAYSYTSRSDEIGDLARALTRLSQEVRDHVRYIESFASDVSHEFKNPLASIRAAVDTAKIAQSPEDREKFLQIIEEETESLTALLTGLRELSRLDMKDEELPKSRISPGETAKHVYSRLGRTQNLMVSETGAFKREIEIEEILFERLLSNLFSNSADFSAEHSVISVLFDYSQKSSLRISVADEGLGFDPDSIENIFNRFYSYRPDTGGREFETGTHSGLGLAIVKSIVQYWQGAVSAGNVLDEREHTVGARIDITIPV